MAPSFAASTSARRPRFSLSPSQTILAGFAGLILVGAVLLTLPAAAKSGRPTPFLTALFTSTSATCVTGLAVVDTADHYSTFGQLVILALIQFGGFGYITSWAILSLILGRRIGLRERIVLTESHNLYDIGGVVRFTRRIIVAVIAIEAVGAVVLAVRWAQEMPLGRALYYGLFHSVSAFNNAGFDLFGNFRSLVSYVGDPVVTLTVAALLMVGGIGFAVLFDLRLRRLSLHSKVALLTTGMLVVGGTVLVGLLEWSNARTLGGLSWPTRILASFFQAVTPRTAGFATLDVAALTEPTLMLVIALMFIGASPGGTGGGIKTTTFFTPLAMILGTMRGTIEPTIFRRRISMFAVYKAVTIALISVAFVVVMAVLLTVVEQVGLLRALFEVVSGYGTVGLSAGLTPTLSAIGQVILIITMYAGRVGLMTLAFGLTRRRRPPLVRYPEERIYIG
jgi:trk system potassium uptake protein TrkH